MHLKTITHKEVKLLLTISKQLNDLIMAAIHYRNRELLMKWVASEHNRNRFERAARELETQKNALLTAISRGAQTK